MFYVSVEQKNLPYSAESIVVATRSRRVVQYTIVWFQCCMLLLEVAEFYSVAKKTHCVNCARVLACLFNHYRIVLIIYFFNTPMMPPT